MVLSSTPADMQRIQNNSGDITMSNETVVVVRNDHILKTIIDHPSKKNSFIRR